MLKNKIISIISTIAVLFSFATVAYAEKTPLITDPTFFIEDLGYISDFEMYGYAVGVSYDEYDPNENPFTFVRTGTSSINYKYSGVGVALAQFKLEGFPTLDEENVMVMSPDTEKTFTTNANGLLNFQYGNDLKTMFAPDTSTWSDKGAVFFLILSPTDLDADLDSVTCSELALYIVDTGTTAQKNPAEFNSWKYSQDPYMIEIGQAEFLAYTAPKSSDVAVESVTLDRESIEFDLNGGTTPVQLNATVLPDEATDKSVTWTSDNAKITVVDGLVSLNGAAKGDTATITATAGSYSDTCTVTVVDTTPIAVESVTLDRESIEFDLNGGTTPVQLNATVLPVDAADPTVIWTSSNPKITVVGGLVSLNGAVAGDTATITATAGDKSDTCTVTVVDTTPVIPDEFDGVITHDDYAGVPAGKMIVTHRTAVTGVSADTRVSVSYNGEEARVFGTTLGEYLQLGAGLTFEGKIRFAVLCDDDLDANAFAFNIQ